MLAGRQAGRLQRRRWRPRRAPSCARRRDGRARCRCRSGRRASWATWTSTPASRSAATAWAPNASSPARPTKRDVGARVAASHAATLAPEPPRCCSIGAGVSLPCASRPGSAATTSTIRSPRTTMLMRRGRDLRRQPRRCAARCGRSTSRLAPAVSRWKKSSRNGVASLPVAPARVRRLQPRGQHAVVQRRGSSCSASRQRVGDHDRRGRAPSSVAGAQHRRRPRSGESTRHGTGKPESAEVEAGEAVGAVAEHGHVERLQALERRADVEDRLHARADDA